ncbi:family 43 glycosylhydrolase [Robertkochia solimangrovi]|uniref:family 43 glycosylhydrolase n=1 Tax=Robertkochia solimangrovi TaxID=2213046 RepID=UPI0011816019|nr:family 43 glycosylhydrolase [Robertkochia solimangrovi]TRZ42048.1 glycosyl hydrolase [Robertkochia solimangrovi]
MVKKIRKTLVLAALAGVTCNTVISQNKEQIREAPAPLFNDPFYDGAADPVLVWNHLETSWWMLYTARRANMPTPDVSAYYGNDIGIASSDDHGQTWVFRGYLDLEFERGRNTFWAPEVVYESGEYHMFVSYIQGVRNHWGGQSKIVHLTSKNLWDWDYKGEVKASSGKVIDATLFKKPDGLWRMWYKDDALGGITMMSESKDLMQWTPVGEPAIAGEAHEGPNVFRFHDYYWMLTDEWHGLRVYRSKDLENWEKQGLILENASERKDDSPSGAHGDVVVNGSRAFIFYFTHPGRDKHLETKSENSYYDNHRTSIQVAPLTFERGTLKANRNKPFDFWLDNE